MDHGVATWSTPAWQARAVAWVDEQLAASGRARTGAPEQPRVRPWATVLRVPTTGGPVWMKAAGPGTAFEAALYPLLARVVPDRVLAPLGIDIERGWMLLPDGGPSLGERREGDELVDALSHALADYGRLQLELAPHVDELLALGVTDMRPAAMPAAFERALLAVRRDGGDEALLTRVAALRPDVAAWCAQLATSPLPAALDHNDLHPYNILGDPPGAVRYYDWGDSVVAHPFAAMLVPLEIVRQLAGDRSGADDPRVRRVRDAYLDVFAAFGTRAELTETLALACRVAKIARVLTWDRALQAAREQHEAVDERWVAAPRETLESVLD
jgi:hypothetical protein